MQTNPGLAAWKIKIEAGNKRRRDQAGCGQHRMGDDLHGQGFLRDIPKK